MYMKKQVLFNFNNWLPQFERSIDQSPMIFDHFTIFLNLSCLISTKKQKNCPSENYSSSPSLGVNVKKTCFFKKINNDVQVAFSEVIVALTRKRKSES